MSSKAHPPPVPPANRSPHQREEHGMGGPDPRNDKGKANNPAPAQGSDEIAPNTRHQGYQQDR
ncbi:hypothetical protein EOD42_16505 [Rhodovarius crocodyli]|uniref:Uncharacterized protein n=1 Tax=Rhodovarius crocodyli TaxID=1979269 RepID=A0A437MDR4_9PROT|nr:hypothetical protein [Rhodovarius crocodyli]RVT95789.1 hypothetical protein EOD42_16505 [Rhodovarius crocodyli]